MSDMSEPKIEDEFRVTGPALIACRGWVRTGTSRWESIRYPSPGICTAEIADGRDDLLLFYKNTPTSLTGIRSTIPLPVIRELLGISCHDSAPGRGHLPPEVVAAAEKVKVARERYKKSSGMSSMLAAGELIGENEKLINAVLAAMDAR